jgi:uncharacterized protein YybS (DUF2232 family)
MDKKAEYFINEFVIGFGFLSGLWIAVGIDPQAEVFKTFATIINTLNPDSGFGFLFFVIPIIILICSILGTYLMGGKLGLIAVAFGILGGLLILASPMISIILLFLGMGLGIIAVES